jgi:hypothetical protein
MCYSAEVSFGTWGVGMLAALVLYSQGTPLRSLAFPLTVTQMQLVEGLRWIDALDERVLALLGKLVLAAQPVAGLYEAGAPQFILPYLLTQGGMELLFGSRDLRFVVAGDGHFRWKWLENSTILAALPYWAALTYAGLRILPLWLNALLLGLYAYYTVKHGSFRTEGSLWCVSVNILWLYYLFR